MESVASILDTYIDEYLAETEIPFTKREVYESTEHILPLTNNGQDVIGMFGVNMFESEYYKEKIPSIRLIYINPKYREPKSFDKVTLFILDYLKSNGFKRVELASNRAISNWLKKRNSRPIQYVHYGEIDYLRDNIKGD